MNPETIIIRFLSTVRKRMRFDTALRWLILCAFIWLFLFGVFLVIDRRFNFPFSASSFFIIGLFASFLTFAFRFYLYRPELIEIAKNLDLRLKLQERLSSAVEIIESQAKIQILPPQNQIVWLQIKDAALHAARLEPKTSSPYLFQKKIKLFPIAALPFLLLPLLPYKSGQFNTSDEVRNAINKEGRVLIESAQNLEAEKFKGTQLSGTIDFLSAEMMDLGKRLKNDKLSKKEALKGISELSSKIQTEQEKAKGADFSKTLDWLSKSLNSAEIFERNRVDSPSQKLIELANKIDASQLTPELRKKLELLLKDLATKLNEAKAPDELRLQLRALQTVQSQSISSDMLRKLAENLKRFEKRQLEIETLQLMMAQLQKSKSHIAMKGLNLDLDIDSEGKLAKIRPSPGDESTNLQAIGGKTEPAYLSDLNKSDKMSDKRQTTDKTDFKSNYAPTRLNQQGSELTLEGKKNENGKNLVIYSREKPDAANLSFVPYQKVYHQYKSAADDAISKERIPVQHRNLIKTYFEAINPKER